MREKIVAGNWKMNTDLDAGHKLASEVIHIAGDELRKGVRLILNVPHTHLRSVGELIRGSERISLGAQNCHEQEWGAYTGEISAPMLKSIGVEYVILGHSERRMYFGESDQLLASKVDIALAHGLKPIFCCGESLETREQGDQETFVNHQLTHSLFHLSEEQFRHVIVAYEPIWAIGTGKTATADQAQEMHASIRKHLAGKYGDTVTDSISILYGGSCKPSNAAEIFSGKDVDGGLIGGASLKSRDFIDIARSF